MALPPIDEMARYRFFAFVIKGIPEGNCPHVVRALFDAKSTEVDLAAAGKELESLPDSQSFMPSNSKRYRSPPLLKNELLKIIFERAFRADRATTLSYAQAYQPGIFEPFSLKSRVFLIKLPRVGCAILRSGVKEWLSVAAAYVTFVFIKNFYKWMVFVLDGRISPFIIQRTPLQITHHVTWISSVASNTVKDCTATALGSCITKVYRNLSIYASVVYLISFGILQVRRIPHVTTFVERYYTKVLALTCIFSKTTSPDLMILQKCMAVYLAVHVQCNRLSEFLMEISNKEVDNCWALYKEKACRAWMEAVTPPRAPA